MSQQEEKNLSQEQPEEEVTTPEEQREHYVPRPKWQIVFAWVLVAIMLVAVISYYYWIVHPYG